ncbi:MAG TPA: nuclear transport factor 2 family protein [Terriglobia bacterium]|nr:nuclear transport factor 2 family protein [Terriglobia bacterium]
MKKLFRPSIVLLSVVLLASFAIGGPVKNTISSEEEFVGFLETAWVNAIVQKDFNVLERVIADDFTGVSPNGQRYTKKEAIADLKGGFYRVESMKLDNLDVRIYGDMALVTFYQDEKSAFGDEDSSGRFAFTDVWLRRNGEWRAVASQGTAVIYP